MELTLLVLHGSVKRTELNLPCLSCMDLYKGPNCSSSAVRIRSLSVIIWPSSSIAGNIPEQKKVHVVQSGSEHMWSLKKNSLRNRYIANKWYDWILRILKVFWGFGKEKWKSGHKKFFFIIFDTFPLKIINFSPCSE